MGSVVRYGSANDHARHCVLMMSWRRLIAFGMIASVIAMVVGDLFLMKAAALVIAVIGGIFIFCGVMNARDD